MRLPFWSNTTCLVIVVLLLVLNASYVIIYFSYNISRSTSSAVVRSTCPDVSTGMMRGRWKSRPLTDVETTEIETFLESVRVMHDLPRAIQRTDVKCGTVTYPKQSWFRALCDPKGQTPCCYGGKCVDRSPDACQCSDCYDLRNRIHAEYSTWEPSNVRCPVKNFTSIDACHILNGTRVFAVGDSFVHQMYIALLMILSGDRKDGTYDSKIPEEIRERCKGMNKLTDKVCRENIRSIATFCNNSVIVHFAGFRSLLQTQHFHSLVNKLQHTENTIVIAGIGIHASYDYKRVYGDYILPVLQRMNNQSAIWPKIIWSASHKLGLMKAPATPEQLNDKVELFNEFMEKHLREHAIPIFDTFNLTASLRSYDGSHFGIGTNMMKAQMLLNFFQELKQKWWR